MKTTTKVVLTFVIAGLISGWIFSSYSAWAQSLYSANTAQRWQYDDPLRGSYNPSMGYEIWYAENVRLTKYADRQWTILYFGFPLALTIATFVCMAAGWLPQLSFGRALPALLLVFGAIAAVFFLAVISRMLLSLPAMILAAYLLVRSVEIATSRTPPRLLLCFCLSLLACSVLGTLIVVLGTSAKLGIAPGLCAIEMSWAALYGRSLAFEGPARPLQIAMAN